MVMGETIEHTEIAIIGSGPAGYVAAIRAGRLGKQVTLIEKNSKGVGGICLHDGCIPSKSLIHIANVFWECTHAQEMGIHISMANLDLKETQQFKDAVVERLTKGIDSLLKKAGVDLVIGTASFEKSNQLHIEQEHETLTLTADKIIIATGSSPAEHPAIPFDGKQIISSTEALQLKSIPSSLAIVGGGYISAELAHVYQKFGSNVSLLIRSQNLLSQVEPAATKILQEKLTSFGVNIQFGTDVLSATKNSNAVKLQIKKDNQQTEMEFEKVLVATGRKPNTGNLGLENTKIQLDENGFIPINEKCETIDSKILAIGDVTGNPLLAHRGFYMGKIAAEVCAGLPSAYNAQVCPAVIFSDPEIAYVGLQETDAIKQGRQILVGMFPFSASGRALGSNRGSGFVKLIADPSSHVILGGLLVGARVSEMIGEITFAIETASRLEDIAGTIHPHPTYGESIMEAAENALKKGVHI